MRLEQLSQTEWAALSDGGQLRIVSAKDLPSLMQRALPGGSAQNVLQRISCSICLQEWTDVRAKGELFLRCHSCGHWLMLDRQNWRMN